MLSNRDVQLLDIPLYHRNNNDEEHRTKCETTQSTKRVFVWYPRFVYMSRFFLAILNESHSAVDAALTFINLRYDLS